MLPSVSTHLVSASLRTPIGPDSLGRYGGIGQDLRPPIRVALEDIVYGEEGRRRANIPIVQF